MTDARLRLLTSDRLEILADDLAARMRDLPLPPLQTEDVVVGSRGMGRWLNLALARRLGIAASIRTPFPFSWARATVATVLDDDPPEVDPFSTDALVWRLHALLGDVASLDLDDDDRAPLERYLRADDGRRRGQLAARLARSFAAYQTYRPDGLSAWEGGAHFGDAPLVDAGEGWQAALWRRLVADAAPRTPLSRAIREATRRLYDDAPARPMPARVCVFGLSAIPPVFLEFLEALARHVEVTIATLAPTRSYVGDVRPRSEQTDVHPLLREWAPAYSALQDQLTACLDRGAEQIERFDERPAPTRVLARVQDDLLEARPVEAPEDRSFDAAFDRSLRLHLCHSERREIEVLRDEVLRAFEDGVVETPSDVLILVPDVDRYAPFVRAVFESDRSVGDGTASLPVRVADGRHADASAHARLAVALLREAGGRAGVTEILELLESEPVAARFGTTGRIGEIRDLVRRAGIRFGRDPESRARSLDLPRLDGGSWREGFDRLVLGYAMGSSETEIDGLVPVSDATTARADLVGRVVTAGDAVFAGLERLTVARPLRRWCEDLRTVVFALTAADDADAEADRAAFARGIDAIAAVGVDDDPIDRSTFLAALERRFDDEASGVGFVSGSITVAELRPMRSLPFRMICVAGLDGDAFPRRTPRDPLDLIVATRRRGDPDPRRDDRQVLLEVIGAARDQLALSAVGFGQRDGAVRALSVCVEELMETIDARFDDDARSRLTVRHHLQPFHRGYGDGTSDEHFTYDVTTIEAARALVGPRRPEAVFADAPVQPREVGEVIELEDLVSFWSNPSRWFVRQVLDLARHFDDEPLEREVFDLDGIGKYAVRAWMAAHADELPAPAAIATRAERDLDRVSGASGRVHARTVIESTLDRWGRVTGHGAPAVPVEIEVEIDGVTVRGSLALVEGIGRVELAPRREKGASLVVPFVRHAVWAASQVDPDRFPLRTHLGFAEGTGRTFAHVDDPSALLVELIDGFRSGHRAPLRFFPELAHEAWKNAHPRKDSGRMKGVLDDPERARVLVPKLEGAWSGSDKTRGEIDDEAVRLCTRGHDLEDLIDAQFLRWTRVVFGGIAAAQGKATS